MAKAKAEKAFKILDSIDPVLFRQQRFQLSLMLCRFRSRDYKDEQLSRNHKALSGIQELLDAIADFVADELGREECLIADDFEEAEEEAEAD